MPRITKPVEERRQEIIDTAKQMFVEYGFDKTQVADVSAKMNVAQGLIYHYFKSKTEILYAVIDEIAMERMEMMKQELDKIEGSAFEKFNLLLGKQPNAERYDKLFASLINDKAIAEYSIKKMTISALPLLLSLIEQGNADKSWNCEYPTETALFILQGVSGIIGSTTSLENKNSKLPAFMNIILRVLGVNQPK